VFCPDGGAKNIPVIARVDIRYKQSLRSGDEFVVTCQTEKEGYKLMFTKKYIDCPIANFVPKQLLPGWLLKTG
jgi:acyl-CoA thioesterase FadM